MAADCCLPSPANRRRLDQSRISAPRRYLHLFCACKKLLVALRDTTTSTRLKLPLRCHRSIFFLDSATNIACSPSRVSPPPSVRPSSSSTIRSVSAPRLSIEHPPVSTARPWTASVHRRLSASLHLKRESQTDGESIQPYISHHITITTHHHHHGCPTYHSRLAQKRQGQFPRAGHSPVRLWSVPPPRCRRLVYPPTDACVEHVELLLSNSQDVTNSSIQYFKMLLRVIFDKDPIIAQTSKAADGQITTSLTSNYLCLQCSAILPEEERVKHGNKKGHRFCM